jgi:Spy/CpxP family protein refolding chaperone
MKKQTVALIGSLILGGLFSGPAWAQAEKKPETKPAAPASRPALRDRADLLAKQLSLTPEQTAKVRVVFEDQDRKVKELGQATQSNAQEFRPKMLKIRDEVRAKLKEILTPEQWERYTKPAPGRPGAPRGEKSAPAAPPAPAK